MKVKDKRKKKGENKDIELTFHHFDFFPAVVVLLYYGESNKTLLPSTSLAQSKLEGSCRCIYLIFHCFMRIGKETQ
jgi:hypothetical protein